MDGEKAANWGMGGNFLAAIMLSLAAGLIPSRAMASVIYDYQFSATSVEGYSYTASWRYKSKAFVTSDIEIAADDLQKCSVTWADPVMTGAVCNSVRLLPDFQGAGVDLVGTLLSWPLGGGAFWSDFTGGSLSARGQYADIQNTPGDCSQACRTGTLTVRGAAVPEPTSLALLSLGFVGLGLARRRKLT